MSQPEGSVNNNLCIPKNYNKFDLPLPDSVNFIDVGIDITDVLRINDKVGIDINDVIMIYKKVLISLTFSR